MNSRTGDGQVGVGGLTDPWTELVLKAANAKMEELERERIKAEDSVVSRA